MEVGMLRKLDDLGRITLPKEYRDFYHLEAGAQICIVATPEGILISNPQYKVIKMQDKVE